MKKIVLLLALIIFISGVNIAYAEEGRTTVTAIDLIGVMKGDEVTQVVAAAFGMPLKSSGEETEGWRPGDPRDSASWEKIGRQFGITSLDAKSWKTIDYIKFISIVRYEYKRLMRINKTCALKFQNGVNQTNPEFPW